MLETLKLHQGPGLNGLYLSAAPLARNVDQESKHHDRMSAGRKTHQLMRQAAGIGYGSANHDTMSVSRMKILFIHRM